MIYFFDGSEEGFLSAFPVACRDEAATVTSRNAQMTLGQTCTFVPTDHVRAERARQRLLSFDGKCMSDLNFLLRSGDAAAAAELMPEIRAAWQAAADAVT